MRPLLLALLISLSLAIANGPAAETLSPASWDFRDTADGWQTVGTDGKVTPSIRGLKIAGSSGLTISSPPISVDAKSQCWVTLRIVSETAHSITLKWTSDGVEGSQSVNVALRGDGMPHSYPVNLGGNAAWTGMTTGLALSPSDSDRVRGLNLLSVAIGDRSLGPPELEIVSFVLDPATVRVGEKAKLVVEAKNTGGAHADSVTAAVTLASKADYSTTTLPPRRVQKLAAGAVMRFEWDILAKDTTARIAVARVTGYDLDAGEKSFELTFQPKPKRE